MDIESGATHIQNFGEDEDSRTSPEIDYVYPSYRDGGTSHTRNNRNLIEYICKGEERFHCLYDERQSSDMMHLAGRLRAAEDTGERPGRLIRGKRSNPHPSPTSCCGRRCTRPAWPCSLQPI